MNYAMIFIFNICLLFAACIIKFYDFLFVSMDCLFFIFGE